jgi:hypothetical protein
MLSLEDIYNVRTEPRPTSPRVRLTLAHNLIQVMSLPGSQQRQN